MKTLCKLLRKVEEFRNDFVHKFNRLMPNQPKKKEGEIVKLFFLVQSPVDINESKLLDIYL